MTEAIRVFIGTDVSQLAAAEVLRQSILETSSLPVEVSTMEKLQIPRPRDVRQTQRTGFSFARWAIPELCDFKGRAIYIDADMMVFTDIAELWNMPMNDAVIAIVDGRDTSYCSDKAKGNKNETSVMLLDCAKAGWTLQGLVDGLGVRYQYKDMMSDLCFLKEEEISRAVPRRWNAMDYWDETVSLLHYTNVPTQPWVSLDNPYGPVWIDNLRRMIGQGKIARAMIDDQVRKGYFRPSLLRELDGETCRDPGSAYAGDLRAMDRSARFVPHRDLMTFTRKRDRAIQAYERGEALRQGIAPFAKLAARHAMAEAKGVARKILRRAS